MASSLLQRNAICLFGGRCLRARGDQRSLSNRPHGGRKKLAASAADDARYGMEARRAETLFRGSVRSTTARPRVFARERPFRYPCVTPTLVGLDPTFVSPGAIWVRRAANELSCPA